MPRRSLLCEQRLKEKGVLNSFTNIDEYILDLIPYDGDLLSMESESSFRVRQSLNVKFIMVLYSSSEGFLIQHYSDLD